MNPLCRVLDWLYPLFGYSTMEVELTARERDQLEERARRIGLTPSDYIQAIVAKHLLDHEAEVAEALVKHKSKEPDISP